MSELTLFVNGTTSLRCDQPLPQMSLPENFVLPAEATLIVLRPNRVLPSLGFASFAPMAAGMLQELAAGGDSASFFARWGAELTYLFPALRSWPEFSGAPALVDIAVPPSRRRLHKESEQIFRVMQALVHLVFRWAARHAPQGLHIHFDRLHETDEHTLRLFMRLSGCLSQSPRVSISASAQLVGEARRDAADVAQEVALPPQSLIQRTVLRAEVLQRACSGFHVLLASQWREAVFGTALNFAPPDLGETAEAQSTRAFVQALLQGESAEKLGGALLAALEASIFTQNHDHAHGLIEQAAPAFEGLLPQHQREVLVHIGIMLAFTMDFPMALVAMDQSLRYQRSPIEEAESHFFAGLLLVKRMDRTLEGRARLHAALGVLQGCDSPAAHCERAWLHNILALSYVNEKNLAQARAQCRLALSHTKLAARSPDSIHIKINVISNLTVLDEYGKDLPGALQRWAFFEPLLGSASPVFKKHYFFRKAGLLVKAGRLAEALPCLRECHQLAEEAGDAFYGDVIARGIAGVHWHLGQPEQAAEWYRASLAAKQHLFDDQVVEVSLALARCLVQAGAVIELGPLLDSLACADAQDEHAEVIARLRATDVSAARAWHAPLPETKLNRPFTFTNLH